MLSGVVLKIFSRMKAGLSAHVASWRLEKGLLRFSIELGNMNGTSNEEVKTAATDAARRNTSFRRRSLERTEGDDDERDLIEAAFQEANITTSQRWKFTKILMSMHLTRTCSCRCTCSWPLDPSTSVLGSASTFWSSCASWFSSYVLMLQIVHPHLERNHLRIFGNAVYSMHAEPTHDMRTDLTSKAVLITPGKICSLDFSIWRSAKEWFLGLWLTISQASFVPLLRCEHTPQ